jgi:hypothetical protein
MKNKIYTFGFIAAALIISPSGAFAQDAGANQSMNQTAIITGGGGNSVNQHGQQNTRQNQIKKGVGACGYGRQSAYSNQGLNQGALVAGSYNSVNQRANQNTVQNQVNASASRFCY